MAKYVESLYLMTTTISTVGYGDYKAFWDTEPNWGLEMAYLTFVTISGIINFSQVTNQIFTYRTLLTVHEMVNIHVSSVEVYLYDISASVKSKDLDF